ncbi:integrase [Kibdelosporangium banguiense]|uniref:Integrase n=1 Tax=Kibdelosporangium banguiense TaxID=1365924 RepID=A0ABS4TFA7_9PSEU|nr:site-specific integrase [Kibdelosporangium banguiense]MBP2322674.1 integrase [Kibdelosporangium banguiense]
MARRNSNGEGSIYRRKDGRWEGVVYVLTTSGVRKRKSLYGKTRTEVHAKLTELKAKQQQGIQVAAKNWRVGEYLDYWLEEVVKKEKKPKTHEQYELVIRRHLKPGIGHHYLTSLGVRTVQAFLNQQTDQGYSARRIETIKTTLSSALTSAMREELVGRNVARLVVPPKYKPDKIIPWTIDEAQRFWEVAKNHRLAPAWTLALFYGSRRGEVLGLRWQDIDQANGTFQYRQQLQRVGRQLLTVSLKTESSERELPMLSVLREGLSRLAEEWKYRRPSEHDLVFTTGKGTPIEPRNFSEHAFRRLCKQARVRVTRFHDTRHCQASMLEYLGVSPKVAQAILGHSSVVTTQQIYQHINIGQKREALRLVEQSLQEPKTAQAEEPEQLVNVFDGNGCRQVSRQSRSLNGFFRKSYLEGPLGLEPRTPCLKDRKIQPCTALDKRLTTVKATMHARTITWMLGCVAVNLAVRN